MGLDRPLAQIISISLGRTVSMVSRRHSSEKLSMELEAAFETTSLLPALELSIIALLLLWGVSWKLQDRSFLPMSQNPALPKYSSCQAHSEDEFLIVAFVFAVWWPILQRSDPVMRSALLQFELSITLPVIGDKGKPQWLCMLLTGTDLFCCLYASCLLVIWWLLSVSSSTEYSRITMSYCLLAPTLFLLQPHVFLLGAIYGLAQEHFSQYHLSIEPIFSYFSLTVCCNRSTSSKFLYTLLTDFLSSTSILAVCAALCISRAIFVFSSRSISYLLICTPMFDIFSSHCTVLEFILFSASFTFIQYPLFFFLNASTLSQQDFLMSARIRPVFSWNI